jgi:hypothetical protein
MLVLRVHYDNVMKKVIFNFNILFWDLNLKFLIINKLTIMHIRIFNKN